MKELKEKIKKVQSGFYAMLDEYALIRESHKVDFEHQKQRLEHVQEGNIAEYLAAIDNIGQTYDELIQVGADIQKRLASNVEVQIVRVLNADLVDGVIDGDELELAVNDLISEFERLYKRLIEVNKELGEKIKAAESF